MEINKKKSWGGLLPLPLTSGRVVGILVGVKANSFHVLMNTGDQAKYSPDKSSLLLICISIAKRTSTTAHGE